jgi:uncharacterized protein (DUF2236 family)
MSVTRADLEQLIDRVRAEVQDPVAGIYGPGSQSWEIGKESVLFVGGGKAALLQLAHPYVAHTVEQHSQTRTDPLGRFQRTFDNVFAMVFGELDDAIKSARRVHNVHTRIFGEISEDVGAFRQGHRYEANDEHALLWVHATLIDTAVQVYELFMRPLSYTEKDAYWQESKRFARLFGIPDSVLPGDWAAFARYNQRMLGSDLIRVGRPALELRGFLFATPRPALVPLFAWLETMTAGLLPERLRREFELEWGFGQAAVFNASVAALRRVYPRLPPRLRYSPAYVGARRRLAGKSGPDHVGRMLERIALMALDAKKTGLPGRRSRRRAA